MKNPQKQPISIKKTPIETNKPQSKDIPIDEQYIRMTRIALDIIEAVENELNSVNTELLLKNFMEITKTLFSEGLNQFDRNKYQSQIEIIFNKNNEVISNYFLKCLELFDNVKKNSIEILKSCLMDLFQIVLNELSTKDKNNEMTHKDLSFKHMQTGASMMHLEETFVSLNNAISGAIKLSNKNTQHALNDMAQYSNSINDEVTQCKTVINDLITQASLPSMGKSSLKVLKDRACGLGKKMQLLSEYNAHIQNEISQIDLYREKLYDDAKKSFRELKQLHVEKIKEITSLKNNYETSGNSGNHIEKMTIIPCKQARNLHVNPIKNNRRNQSVSPTRKRILISGSNNNMNNTRNNHQTEYNTTNSNVNSISKEIAKSTEHYKSKTVTSYKKTIDTTMTNNNNKALNTSHNTTTHYDTTPNFYNSNNSNCTQVQLGTELNDRNIDLHSELEKLSKENEKLKKNIAALRQAQMPQKTDTTQVKNMLKSKSLRDFLNCPSNNPASPCDDHRSSKQLAENILTFLGNMKELQNSICKKAGNVNELKKDFEKEKKDLYLFASALLTLPLIDNEQQQVVIAKKTNQTLTQSQSQSQVISSSKAVLNNPQIKQLKDDLAQFKKTCKDYENIITNLTEQINSKNIEINKISTELQKAIDNKKTSLQSTQAKLKDYESKISIYEEKIAELQQRDKVNDLSFNSKSLQIIKENEDLKGSIDEIKLQNNKLKKSNDELTILINKSKESNSNIMKSLQLEKEELELKNKTLLNELSTQAQMLTLLKIEHEKETKEHNTKMTSLLIEIKESNKKGGDKSRIDNEKVLGNEKQIMKYENDISNLKNTIQRLQGDIDEGEREKMKLKEELTKQSDAQTIVAEYKLKLLKKDNEVNEMKKMIGSAGTVKKEKNDGGMQEKREQSYRKEVIDLAQMLHKINEEINAKYKDLRIVLSSHEIRRNPNEAFLIDEEDEYIEDKDSANDNTSNPNANNISSNTIKQIAQLLNRTKTDYTEINQTIILIFNLIEKHLKQGNASIFQIGDLSSNTKNSKLSPNNNQNPPTATKDNEANIEKLQEEISILKNFFTECTNTIFESIKVTAPHMVDEESDLSFNIASGNSPQLNLLDLNNSPKQSPQMGFDADFIATAVAKFKAYNNDINDQIKKLQSEKEEMEKESHNNLIKAQAYKTALDDAIMKINSNSEDTQVKMMGLNNTSNTSGHFAKDNARTFTVEDLENPQSENNKPRTDCSIETNSKFDYKKINSDLMMIQSDLLKKMESKEEECLKLQETVNALLLPKDSNDTDIQVTGGQYKQLLLLYHNEQDKNHEFRTSYYTLLNEFSDIINSKQGLGVGVGLGLGLESKNKSHKKSRERHDCFNIDNVNKKVLTLGNESDDNDNEIEDEELSEAEYNLHANILKQHQNRFGKNLTHSQIKISNRNEDYLGMLNKDDLQSNHSADNQHNELQIQEILNDKKELQEQEELLKTQLHAVKKELKETREIVRKLTDENLKLKEHFGSNALIQKEELLGPLKSALERLITEMTFTPKVKEYMTVILRVIGYSDDKIMLIYQAKDKKKGFFNLFK